MGTNLVVTPATGRLSLAPLLGTNLDKVPDLAPAPSNDKLPPPPAAEAPVAPPMDETETNPPDPSALDPTKKTEVGTADIVPASSLAGLSHEELEKRVATLSDDLVSANAESEYFRQQWQDLRLRDEALGVDALTVDERKLEDKLVQAVKEAYQSELRRREAVLLLDKLRTTTEALLKTAPNYDPKIRGDYEVAVRASREYIAGHNGTSIPIGISLGDAKVADLNPQLNAVVLNVGTAQGVKEGMPFLVYQNNAQVGVVKIVLARELVSAALVESLQPKVTLKVGDRVAVETQ